MLEMRYPNLKPCLLSHAPLDYVVLLLGTNDLKRRLNLVAEDVAVGIDQLIIEIKTSEALNGTLKNIIVLPPLSDLDKGQIFGMYEGAEVKSLALGSKLESIANSHGATFFDTANLISSSEVDGIHLDMDSHQKIGEIVANLPKDMQKF